MTQYYEIYKCKLCGETYLKLIDVAESLTEAGFGIEPEKYHHCKDGSRGVLNFCGIRKKEE